MQNWLILLAVVIGIFTLLTVVGLIKNIVRTGIAVLVGYLVALGLSYGAGALGIERIPNIAFLIIACVVALVTLVRMKR